MKKFINADCMDLDVGLPSLPNNHFGLAIVDTPYGINESGQTNKSRSKLAESKDYGNKAWDKNSPNKDYFKELFRVSKNQVIFGANHFMSKIAKDSSCWIVWDKQNGSNDFADCELAWTSFKSAVRIARFRWQGMIQGDMKNKEIRIHPTQKPVCLYRWIISNYAKKGDLILDTHVGSASSLIALESLGFNYIGYEIDKDYYTEAVKRMKKGIQKSIL